MYNEVNNYNTVTNRNSKKPKIFLIGGIVLGVIAILIVLLLLFRDDIPGNVPIIGSKTEITILVAPVSAKIEIDGKEYKNGTYEFPTGSFTATISANGFETKEVGVVAEAGEIALLYEYLTPTTGKFSLADYDLLKYLSPDETITALLLKRAAAISFLNTLPIEDTDKQLYISNQSSSPECPADPNLCIGISSLGSVTEEEALNLISERGYDPSEFTIFFEQGTENYRE